MVESCQKKPDIDEFFSFLQSAFHPLQTEELDTFVRNIFEYDDRGRLYNCLLTLVPYERLPIDAEDLSSRKTYARPVLIRQYRSLRFANKEGNICRLTPNSAFVPVRDSAVASISTSKVQDFNSYATLTEAQKKTVTPVEEKNFLNQIVIQCLDSLETDVETNTTHATLLAVDPTWLIRVSQHTCDRKAVANLCIQYGSQIFYDPSFRNAYELWSNPSVLLAFLKAQRVLVVSDIFTSSTLRSTQGTPMSFPNLALESADNVENVSKPINPRMERFSSEVKSSSILKQQIAAVVEKINYDIRPQRDQIPEENIVPRISYLTSTTTSTKSSPIPESTTTNTTEVLKELNDIQENKSRKNVEKATAATEEMLRGHHKPVEGTTATSEKESIKEEVDLEVNGDEKVEAEERIELESSDSEKELSELIDFLKREHPPEDTPEKRVKIKRIRTLLDTWQQEWRILNKAISNAESNSGRGQNSKTKTTSVNLSRNKRTRT